jgi:hypothetical protein
LQLITIQHISLRMNWNGCNSAYGKLCTYATHATQLQLCRSNYCTILVQIDCNYNGNVMLALFSINPSKSNTLHYWDFCIKITFFLKYWYKMIMIGVPFATILQLHDYNSLIFWWDILFINCSYFPCFNYNVIAYISCLGTLIARHYGSNGHDF